MTRTYQVVGIGNAMVDVLSHCEDRFLEEHGVRKGIMQLIDAPRASQLYAAMGTATEVSGGSAANTVAGIAGLGGRTAYVGKVCDDKLGDVFVRDMRSLGAACETPRASSRDGLATGRCMVLVTPDGERSMNTYLGASEFLGPDDVDETCMARTEWIYLEGYRFDGPDSRAAFAKAISACRGAGGRVSLTLSDPFCVERHRESFLTMIRDHVDLLFCNQHELTALYQTDRLGPAVEAAVRDVGIIACTRGPHGAVVATPAREVRVPAHPVTVRDVTGAGDLFAAGFLSGLTTGRDLEVAARMGCLAAGETIGHIGARPEADLRVLFAREGLLR